MSGQQAAVVSPARAIAMSLAALAAATLPVFLTGALQGRIAADMGIGPGAIGAAVAGFFVTAALSSVPGGRITDRIGATAGLRLGMLIATVAAIAIALGASDRWQLTAALALGGVAVAFVDPSTARALTATVPYRHHGAAFGIKEASVPVASLLAGLVLPLLGAQLGWRPAFYLGAGIAVLTALLVPSRLDEVIGRGLPGPGGTALGGEAAAASPDSHTGAPAARGTPASGTRGELADDTAASRVRPADDTATSRDRPADDTARDAGAPAGGAGVHGPDRTTSTTTQGPARSGRAPLPTGVLLAALAVCAALAGGVAAAVAAFLVPTAEVTGLRAGAAGVLLSVGSLGSVLIRLGSGMRVDRRPATELTSIAGLTAIGAAGIGLLALLSAPAVGLAAGRTAGAGEAGPGAMVVALLVLAGVASLGAGWGWTGLVFLAAVRLEPTRPARAAGAVLAGLGAGGSLGPALLGILAEQAGFAATWTLGAALMGLAAVGVWLLRARMPTR